VVDHRGPASVGRAGNVAGPSFLPPHCREAAFARSSVSRRCAEDLSVVRVGDAANHLENSVVLLLLHDPRR
jgi:hypothetical protein